ncbi:hypothetical protein FRC08_012528 [Ceratobasidium sp. 394]|nr:hypothetical protein FRC08_012528 [Ceratobasidium sp. 394]
MRLITSELRLLVPGTSHVILIDCAHAALALLQHVIAEFAPRGYLSYGQDFVPFSTAYAGAWLFKQYSRLDETMRATTVDTFRLLSETCRAQTRFERDTTSYYCRFFDHLVKYLAPANGAMAGGMFLGSAGGGHVGGTEFGVQMDMGMMPLSLPPLEDMDATWLLATNGFDNWWQDANLGSEPFGSLLS